MGYGVNIDGSGAGKAPLVALVVLVVVVFLLQKGVGVAKGRIEPEWNLLKLIVIIQNLVATLLPVLLLVYILRLAPVEALGLHAPPLGKTIVAVVVGLVLIVIVNLILPYLLRPTPEFLQANQSIVAYRNVPELLLSLFTISIVASVADELFFRGLILQGLIGNYGKLAAVLITAVLTALFHTLEPFKLAHSFCMGVIFAASVVSTGSVYTSIILHGLHNALALLPRG